jgi:mono/diheme cytochrome c family protein
MSKTRWLATVLSAVALAAAGCGGGDEEDTAGGETTTEQAAPPAETGGGETSGGDTAGAGEELFANTCGGCHVLAAAGTNGQTGPNLDELKPDADRVKEAIAEGPGIMPENLYEGAEADQVAQYVADNAGK